MSMPTMRMVAGALSLVAGVALAAPAGVSGGDPAKGAAGGMAPLYMVVDLAGGTNAASYPVAYYATSNDLPCAVNSDPYKTTNLLMRLVPAGTFTMGSPTNELGRPSLASRPWWRRPHDNESLHQVTLTKGFYIGIFEVTQKQWELVMGNKPSYFTNVSNYASRPVEQVSYYDIRENPNNSAINRNWPATTAVCATSFMGKLRAKTGLSTFDLPTEAQWEYACRAGTTTALNSGYNLTNMVDAQMSEVGRYRLSRGSCFTQGGDTTVGTTKVGSYRPNVWGLYDMHGNVWEWCLDWHGAYPGTVSDPAGAASGANRVGRGGSWFVYADGCRSAVRGNRRGPDCRGSGIGFRAARTLP
jgi:formylglycine-generating enzyme required for sulfatase activity